MERNIHAFFKNMYIFCDQNFDINDPKLLLIAFQLLRCDTRFDMRIYFIASALYFNGMGKRSCLSPFSSQGELIGCTLGSKGCQSRLQIVQVNLA